MPSQKAKENFTKKRLNCAQAVAHALHEHYGINEDALIKHAAHGSGNAPEGWCGAPYAAKKILEKLGAGDKTAELEKMFIENAGSLKCAEIRKNRKFSCIKCIEAAADFVAKNCPVK